MPSTPRHCVLSPRSPIAPDTFVGRARRRPALEGGGGAGDARCDRSGTARPTAAAKGDTTMASFLSVVDDPERGGHPVRPRKGGPTREDLQMMERTRAARDLLSSKWKVDLLYLLARGVHRYSRLYDNLEGASKKMLTDSLRGLERDGFVEREVYAEVPVRVEYSLTALGWAATELLMALADWADKYLADVEQARQRYRQVVVPRARYDSLEAA